jgi:hypothetical protein
MGEGMGTRGVRAELRRLLVERFDEEDLRTLCFGLEVSYDRLPGRGMAAKARELVAHLDSRRQLADLIRVGHELRPDVAWPEVGEATEAAPGLGAEHARPSSPRSFPRSLVALSMAIAVVVAGIVVAWRALVPAPDPMATMPTRVAIETYHGRYWTAKGIDRSWDLVAETTELLDWEAFRLIGVGRGKVAIQTAHGMYVTAMDEARGRALVAETEKRKGWWTFTLIYLDNGEFALKTAHGRFVTALGEDRGYDLVAEATEIKEFERFKIVPLEKR